jgi:hypothetical protein
MAASLSDLKHLEASGNDYTEHTEHLHCAHGGTRWRRWLRPCATSRKVAGSIPDGVFGIFLFTYFCRQHYGPGVDSSSNGNENREYFLRGKGGRCVELPTLPTVLNSASLNLQSPQGLSMDCNARAVYVLWRSTVLCEIRRLHVQ